MTFNSCRISSWLCVVRSGWTTTPPHEYHPQANGLAELYSLTTVSRLRLYVSDYQTKWDNHLMSMTYAYNVKMHRSIKDSRFSLEPTRVPHGPTTIVPKTIFVGITWRRSITAVHKTGAITVGYRSPQKKPSRNYSWGKEPHHDRLVRFPLTGKEGDEAYQSSPHVFPLPPRGPPLKV